MDNQNKPQDNQKAESAKDIFHKHYPILKPSFNTMTEWNCIRAMEEYASQFQSRIAELERNELSDTKHIASLEKQLKQYEQIIDIHIISSANYSPDYINKVLAQNAVYRESLEEVNKTLNPGNVGSIKRFIKQALNHKDNG